MFPVRRMENGERVTTTPKKLYGGISISLSIHVRSVAGSRGRNVESVARSFE